MKKKLFFLIFILNCSLSFSQKKQSFSSDSSSHSVKKATILSAVIPGAGQIYNHMAMPKGKKNAFWKVPIIYAGLGYTGYLLIQNQRMSSSLKTEYQNRQNGGDLDEQWSIYDDAAIITLYKQYLDLRDMSILGFSAAYLLQVLDANIEANFVHFDISKDLSLGIQPKMLFGYSPGLSLTLHFN